jgi:hypothetical protein
MIYPRITLIERIFFIADGRGSGWINTEIKKEERKGEMARRRKEREKLGVLRLLALGVGRVGGFDIIVPGGIQL